MASIRQRKRGDWEVDVRNILLPRRRSFLFDTENEAREWAQRVEQLLAAGIVPPGLGDEEPKTKRSSPLLGPVLLEHLRRGQHSRSDEDVIARLHSELGHIRLGDITYAWCEAWVDGLKTQRNQAPGTIRKRVGALSRALDAHHLRSNPGTAAANPLHLLPRGYSSYTRKDAETVVALGLRPKVDVMRDRRLAPDEEAKILRVLAGEKPRLALRFEHILNNNGYTPCS